MTVAQVRPGSGGHSDAFASRLTAIQAPVLTAAQRAKARDIFIRWGQADLLEMVGLEEGQERR